MNITENIQRSLLQYVSDILNSDVQLSSTGIHFLPENILDIEFQIKNNMLKTGAVGCVMTPKLTYNGHDGLTQAFNVDELNIEIVENPTVWRSHLKNNNLSSGTSQDLAIRVSDLLAGPQNGHFGEFNTKYIEAGENNNLLVTKVVLLTLVQQYVSGEISGTYDRYVTIPFVTSSDVSGLYNTVSSLSNLIIGFDTEGIKLSVANNTRNIATISSQISSLTGDYATKSYVIDNFLSNNALNDYYTKSLISNNYLTKGNYLTSHLSLSNYYTKTQSDSKYLTSHQSLDNYYNKTLADSRFLTSHQSLSNYYNKTQVNNNFLSNNALVNYSTKSEISNTYQTKGNYLTSHLSLSNYYTKSESDSKYLTSHQSLSNYYNKQEISTNYQTKGNYILSSDLSNYIKTSDLTGYVPLSDYNNLKTKVDQLIKLFN